MEMVEREVQILTGKALDWAVALVEGIDVWTNSMSDAVYYRKPDLTMVRFNPSNDWITHT